MALPNDLLQQGAELLQEAGAREVYVFGSTVRGTASEESDVDLAVSGLPPASFFRVLARLSDLFDRSVDLVDLDEKTPFTEYLKEKGGLRRVA
jgi:predicted nucleotidyltransferase